MLLFKIFLAPVLIALISLAGRKWGPGISGWLLGIPFSSGPILFFLSMEQGKDFAARTAVGSLLGIIAWAMFNLVYAWCCRRLTWWYSTMIGWAAYFLAAALVLRLHLRVFAAFVLVVVLLSLILFVFPKSTPSGSPGTHGRYDILLRMLTAAGMIVSLTETARFLGPMRSGILSAFPAYTTILAVFAHRHGADAAINVLRGVAVGLYTAATFFLILSPSLVHLNIAASFSLAIAGALVIQTMSLLYIRRRA
ncbi:MAG TPA: hypothetical protein VI636_09515 [Candidatus Angelobacter sp.]